jgi:hypothetical protein
MRETDDYFKWINDRKTVERNCRMVVDIWEAKGYSISRCQSHRCSLIMAGL